MGRREFQTGRTISSTRRINSVCTDRLVKVGVDFIMFSASPLAFDQEEEKTANQSQCNQPNYSKGPCYRTFVLQESITG